MRISEINKITVIVEASGGLDINLPESVTNAFVDLGELQRGEPEKAMLQVQRVMGGGVLSFVVEHVGDLTHRMSHMAKYSNAGYEMIVDKVNKTYRSLTHGYGFDREFKENVKNNAESRDISPDDLLAVIDNALKSYADEHSKLPVYNKAQWQAREAAIALGKRDWDKSALLLYSLKRHLNTDDEWTKYSFQYELDSNNNPKKYPY